jgi:predicted glycosyltransferase
VLIYALGGGWGHLTRATALARVAAPHVRVRILSNSPYAAVVRAAVPEIDIVALDPAVTAAAAREQMLRAIESMSPRSLVVDTFPRGLGGELKDVLDSFSGLKVLVARDLNPRYAASAGLREFVGRFYDLVVNPGDSSADCPDATTTAPWLVRSSDEVLPRDRALRLLGVDGQRPCVIVCAAGNQDELEWYGAVVSHLRALGPALDVRCIAPICPPTCPSDCWFRYWPAIDLYAAADVVVGAAGYNTIYECLACRVPLIARPWPRKYDRQPQRAHRAGVTIVETPEEAATAVFQTIGQLPREARQVRFRNGATEAFDLIEQPLPQKLSRPLQKSAKVFC